MENETDEVKMDEKTKKEMAERLMDEKFFTEKEVAAMREQWEREMRMTLGLPMLQ